MNMASRDIRTKMRVYYLAGLLTLMGLFTLYAIFVLPNAENYPGVRLASAVFSFFSIASGVGVLLRQRWVSWSLMCLLLSMYGVLIMTHYATGKTPHVISIVAFLLLPVVAFLLWRVVKQFVFDDR